MSRSRRRVRGDRQVRRQDRECSDTRRSAYLRRTARSWARRPVAITVARPAARSRRPRATTHPGRRPPRSRSRVHGLGLRERQRLGPAGRILGQQQASRRRSRIVAVANRPAGEVTVRIPLSAVSRFHTHQLGGGQRAGGITDVEDAGHAELGIPDLLRPVDDRAALDAVVTLRASQLAARAVPITAQSRRPGRAESGSGCASHSGHSEESCRPGAGRIHPDDLPGGQRGPDDQRLVGVRDHDGPVRSRHRSGPYASCGRVP